MSVSPGVKVLAVGNYACSNVGDELLLATLKQWIEGEGGELIAITLNPAHTKKLHGLDAVSYYDLPAIAEAARQADVLVLGGGGIFTDIFEFTLPQLYAYPSFTIAQFASVCYLARQFDLRLVLWGQGVGPLATSDARQITSDLFSIADHVSVRDAGSAELLREIGVEREVPVAPDPVWAMELPDALLDLRVKFPQLTGKKILVVNPLVCERSAELSTKLVAALKECLDDGWACLWIGFQTMAIEYEDYHFALPSDGPLIEEMVAQLGTCCTHVIWDEPHIHELLPALRQVDAAVMARFHGNILALRVRIPLVVIEYDDKVTQAAQMAGVPPGQRLRIEDTVEDYAAAVRRVMDKHPDQRPWRPGTDVLDTLAADAGAHRTLITEAIASARTRARERWKSERYDWLFAWCTQMDRQRWQAERKTWELTSALEQARQATDAVRRTALAERETALTERETALTERDTALAEQAALKTLLKQSRKQFDDITASYSWRVTAPIRFAIRLARHGLLAEDRRWIEDRLRRAFHSLPISPARKEALFQWYGRRFGYPLLAQESTAAGEGAHNPATAGEFLAPEHWSHHSTPYGVLCLPIIDWHFRFQRPQQLARRFASKGHPVLYAGLHFGARLAAEPLETGVTGLTLPGSQRANVYKDMPGDAEVDRMVDALLDQMRSGPPLVWVCVVQLPFWGPVAERLRQRTGCPVVYDCMDDHAGFSTNGETMLAAEDRLLHHADLVIASSQLLHDKVQARARRAALIRNAVDYDHFAAVPDTPHAAGGRRTIGYYGAIADWFDSDMLAAVARSRPDWRFVLIGSTFSADTAPLAACFNIVLTGEKPYADLPALIEDWDCCVIPFKRLPLTEATNPVKVYEMLAAGKPVVAVALPELLPIAHAGHIALADTAEEFVQAIEQEVARDDHARQAARRRYASENTWQIRQEALDLEIRDLFPLVSIIIVTYNNLALNRLCLDSVFNDTDYPNFEVIVVDNASADGTPEYLEGLTHPRLTVIRNDDNRGFSGANNQGLAVARGQYLCLLNNDTVVAGAWLSTLISHLKANPQLGLVGPVTNAIGNEARIPVGYRNLLDMPAWAEEHCRRHRGQLEDISMLAFFCVAMPRAVFETVGPLDERFGIGMFEDDDYNRRVREAGSLVKLARDSYIHHWQRASFNLLSEEGYLRTYHENEKKYRAKWAAQSMTADDAEAIAGMVAASRRAPGTIIFAPSIGWDIHLFQRPHHLARVLAQAGHVVVFDCSNSNDSVHLIQEIEPRLYLFKGEPELLEGLEKPTLWTFTYNYDYRDRFPPRTPVIYDWIDDLTVFPHDQAVLGELHARAMKEATVVACVARKLHESALRERPDAIYLPNAVEEGRFDRPPTPNPALDDEAFSRLVSSGKPIAGYYGALARWFDYELLARTAELRPDWNFVLIGPAHDASMERSNLSRHDNITWLGPRDYESLPGYLHLFDVAMIPFRINEITVATSPLKLFEYFAGGRPVVATPMPECMAFAEVRIARVAGEFASALDAARSEGGNLEFQARLASLARNNTWRARTQTALGRLAA